jgi:hypothetical protein
MKIVGRECEVMGFAREVDPALQAVLSVEDVDGSGPVGHPEPAVGREQDVVRPLAGLDVANDPSPLQVDDRQLVGAVQGHPGPVAAWRDREIVRLGFQLDAPSVPAAPDDVDASSCLVGYRDEIAGGLDVVWGSAQFEQPHPVSSDECEAVAGVEAGGRGSVVGGGDVVRPAGRLVTGEHLAAADVNEHNLVGVLDPHPDQRPGLSLGRRSRGRGRPFFCRACARAGLARRRSRALLPGSLARFLSGAARREQDQDQPPEEQWKPTQA